VSSVAEPEEQPVHESAEKVPLPQPCHPPYRVIEFSEFSSMFRAWGFDCHSIFGIVSPMTRRIRITRASNAIASR